MSLIQKIRDKYARISVIAIALALLGFILMDAFSGKAGFGNDGPSSSIGKVNGTAIGREDFMKKVENAARQYGEDSRPQIVAGLWDQEVNDLILQKEYEKLGLTITERELRYILYEDSLNRPQFLAQAFTDPNTGRFDAVAAQQQINQALKSGTPDQKISINEQIDIAKKQRLMNKYMAMLTNTVYFPKWFLEKRNVDNSLLAKAAFVAIPYSTVADTTVKVSDDEIRNYIKDHEDDFEQEMETRSINYVLFSAAPSKADSLTAYNTLLALKPEFDSTKNYEEFTRKHNSPFLDNYVGRNEIRQTNKDSILSAQVGVVYGPYLDVNQSAGNGSYAMSKIIDTKQWPDTVKARHILVATMQQDQQTGQLMRVKDDSAAKKLIDSIQGLLNRGENFDSLVVKFSDDQGSKATGGVYDNIVANGQMVKEFTEFIFGQKTGSRDIVKTQFGYHIIEVLSQKGSSPAYKIAYLYQPIIASDDTDREALNKATQFAGNSRDINSFNENADKLRSTGVNRFPATDIQPMAFNIQGINASARSFVKDIFEADKGDVMAPQRIGENYVVAVVTEVAEAGLQSVNAARPVVEPILRKKKQGEQIIKNLGAVTSLEQVAAKYNTQVQPVDSIRFAGGAFGYEPKVLGAMFNPANKGKISEPIAGSTAVYVLRVDNITTTPVEAASIEDQRKMLEMQAKQNFGSQMQQGTNPFIEPLKKSAKIKDNRSEFY